jgi:MoaA/NifB/PqqE/SkfB family radical SAM enzyme
MDDSQAAQASHIDRQVALPSFLQIEPVGQCNLHCRMCPVMFREDGPLHGRPAFMPFEDFVAAIGQFPHLKELHLQGMGEPMMHPQFFDMVAFAASRSVIVSTNSNMTLISEARAERCITSGLSALHISFDGATPATYEDIRLGSKFERVAENVQKVCRAKARLGSESPSLQLIVVIMRRNLTELPELVRLAHRWSIPSIFVQHLSQEFGESTMLPGYEPVKAFIQQETLLREDPQQVDHYFEVARSVAVELAIELRLPRLRPRRSPRAVGRHACDWPWNGVYLTYQGYAIPCCMIATPDRLHMGNMIEHGVEQVWNGDRYQSFRERLDSDDPPEICRS